MRRRRFALARRQSRHVARASPSAPGKHVICVYTLDGGKHATLVRERLRALGFVAKLGWKSDEQTYSGEYATTTAKRISQRFE